MSGSESECSALTDLSSELSSAPSSPRSPLIYPGAYPTPDSSQTQSTYSSSSEQDCRKRGREEDGCFPVKKRKTAVRKERTTIRIDLKLFASPMATEKSFQVEALLKVLRKRRKIVVVAGAGISTSAGGEYYSQHYAYVNADEIAVPDFRSSNGLFNTLKSDNKLKASGKQLFDASVYQTDSSTSSFHDMVRTLSKVVEGAKATPFHHMLATLADEGRLMRLYTQNVDGIDTSLPPLRTEIPLPSKGPWPRTIQLHGSLKKMVCAKCRDLRDFDPELFDGPNPPQCTSCIDLDKVRTEEAGKRSHGIGKLRPRLVLYNEQNPDDEAIGTVVAADLRARPDAIIVVGTSMEIPGVKRIVREMCGVIRTRKDGTCVWINRGPPPIAKEFEHCWDLVVAGDCDQVAELADMRKWYEEPREGVRVTDSEAERAKEKQKAVKVIVKSSNKKSSTTPSLLAAALNPELQAIRKTGLKLNFKVLAERKKPESVAACMKTVTTNKPKKALSKPATSKAPSKASTSKASRLIGLSKINSAFKVTKGQQPGENAKKSPEDHKPFEPIPPRSARSNSIRAPPNEVIYINPAKIEVKIGAPASSKPGRLKRLSEETVSPVGAVPNDMAQLLN
ncbi:MAG: hypothetical protein Q9163_000912 [Psora crenata]